MPSASTFPRYCHSLYQPLTLQHLCLDLYRKHILPPANRPYEQTPIPESFARAQRNGDFHPSSPTKTPSKADLAEETFLTTDTSFVDNPPSSKAPSKFATPAPAQRPAPGLTKRGGAETGRLGRGGPTIGRGTGRGTATRGSGIARKPRGGR